MCPGIHPALPGRLASASTPGPGQPSASTPGIMRTSGVAFELDVISGEPLNSSLNVISGESALPLDVISGESDQLRPHAAAGRRAASCVGGLGVESGRSERGANAQCLDAWRFMPCFFESCQAACQATFQLYSPRVNRLLLLARRRLPNCILLAMRVAQKDKSYTNAYTKHIQNISYHIIIYIYICCCCRLFCKCKIAQVKLTRSHGA